MCTHRRLVQRTTTSVFGRARPIQPRTTMSRVGEKDQKRNSSSNCCNRGITRGGIDAHA